MKHVAVGLLALVLLAGGCRNEKTTPTNLNAANKVAVRTVRLYFESSQMLLSAEPRNVALPESQAAAIPVVLRELIKGPAWPASARVFPRDTVLRGAYLLPGGTVVVDLGGGTLTQGWGTGSHEELMAVYSLVETVSANFSEARRVRVLVNGMPADTLAGHVSVGKSLGPLRALVDPRSR